MDAQTFLCNFGTIAEAPGGVDRLRALILDLAVHGQLVPQDPNDQPVSCEQLAAGRKSLLALRQISKPRHPEGSAVEKPPYSIPATWHWYHLGDVGAVVGGGTPSSQESRFWADGNAVPWLTPADMRGQTSRYVTHGERDITVEGLASSSAQLLPARSVLFSSRAPIGHVGIVQTPLATNQGFKSSVPYLSDMSEYLYLFLRKVGPEVSDAATGTTFKEVSGKQVALIPVPVPPLAEQERIVVKVDELMQLCDALEARQQARHRATTRLRASSLDALTNVETDDDLHTAWSRIHTNWEDLTDHPDSINALRQTILQLAVRGKLVEQRKGEGSAIDLIDQIRQERDQRGLRSGMESDGKPFFRVPGSWAWSTFGFITDARLGKMLDKAKNTGQYRPYLRNTNVQWFRFELNDVSELRLEDTEYEEYELRVGDLLICEGGEPGRAAVCDGAVAGLIFQKALHRARPLLGTEPWYLAFLLRSYAGHGLLAPYFTGATIKHLTGKSLAGLPVPLPPVGEQRRIVDRVWELMKLCDDLEAGMALRWERHAELARTTTSVMAL